MKSWLLVALLTAALCVSQWMLWLSHRDLAYYQRQAKLWRENYDFCRGMRP